LSARVSSTALLAISPAEWTWLQIHSFQRHIGVVAELLEKRRSALLIRVDTGIPNASAMFESVWWLCKVQAAELVFK
jgi:hypothetical protein